ncbi:MAG TPA: Holliday junction branch migration protein RuvA [Vicinamibacterales bacterium]|nr:Holliday junction branch migration protein RuvA [Vicinamibacterales bacterium]
MIAYLRGRLIEKHPNRVVIDVNGVGYEVHVPLSSYYGMTEPGTEIALCVHTHVREDTLALFGFRTPLELQLFERLIEVNGIGPRLALAVLSGIEPPDLIAAVQRGDVARLTAIPGVGKKTAERISLELKDRLEAIDAAPAAAPGPGSIRADVVSALLNLGYHRAAAEKAVDAVLGAEADAGFEEALRGALRRLSR